MIHLKRIEIKADGQTTYPFSLPWIKNTTSIEFTSPVTVFVGENGCGKSTLMDLLATSLNLYRITSDDVFAPNPMAIPARSIKPFFTLTRPLGFFFEAEAFITYIHFLTKEKELAKAELKRVQKEYANKSDYAKTMASVPHAKSLGELENMYENDLSMRSHGEAYLDFFASRLKPKQLYLLDEPETPLSTQNQLTLLAMMKEAVELDCQFIIATHSPIIMAYPEATIYEIGKNDIKTVLFDEIESVQLLKQFLNQPGQFIRHL